MESPVVPPNRWWDRGWPVAPGAGRARMPSSSDTEITGGRKGVRSIPGLSHVLGEVEAGTGASPECCGDQSALGRGVDAAAGSFIGKPKHGEVGGRAGRGLDVPVRRAVSKCSQVGSV